MNRYQMLQDLLPVLSDHLVVCNIGAPSQELFALGDRPGNFYMLGTMGLASSIGLGLALAQERPVIAIEGDGAVLSNLGTLATIANNPRGNFTLLIVDNASYGSTGDQPTWTAGRTSLAAVARGCGCAAVVECPADRAAAALRAALDSPEMTVIVARCESGNVKVPVVDMNPVAMRLRFMEAVRR